MPYVSKAQERWAHTAAAKKAGFPTDEFDKASKGRLLPEHVPQPLKKRIKNARRKVKK